MLSSWITVRPSCGWNWISQSNTIPGFTHILARGMKRKFIASKNTDIPPFSSSSRWVSSNAQSLLLIASRSNRQIFPSSPKLRSPWYSPHLQTCATPQGFHLWSKCSRQASMCRWGPIMSPTTIVTICSRKWHSLAKSWRCWNETRLLSRHVPFWTWLPWAVHVHSVRKKMSVRWRSAKKPI